MRLRVSDCSLLSIMSNQSRQTVNSFWRPMAIHAGEADDCSFL